MPDDLRRRFLHSLYQHGLYLEHNLSVYFSPNTHLLGEAVALHLLGRVFPTWPHSRSWEQRAGDVVAQELRRQVREDGGHFEQSTYYHVYALDFFLLHKLVARSVPEEYDAALIRMAELLRAVMGHNWVLPFFGDDDGGRLFHPYGERDRFGRGTLAAAAVILGVPKWLRDPEDLNDIALWWLGAGSAQAEKGPPVSPVSQLFAATGLGVLRSDDISVVVDAGPFGPGSGGHSHADTLNIVVTAGSVEVLVDAGTYTYVGDARARDWFRSTPAHNTIRVSGVDQAAPAGPFRWASRPDVSLEAWQTTPEYDYLDASCCYRGIIHRRALVFVKSPAVLFVVDFIRGPEGEQTVEQFWHTGAGTVAAGPSRFRIGDSAELILSEGTRTALSIGGENGWRSRALGHREEAPVIVAVYNGRLPAVMASAISFSKAANLPLRTEQSAGRVLLDFGVSIEIGEPGHVNIDASRQWEYRDSPTLR
jgi:hypothetical protein